VLVRYIKDGFEAASFHAKCDSKPNTLIIIKSTNDNVFGGYTEKTWNHTGGFKADPNSFIFSLINKLNKLIKMKWSKNYSICCNSSNGPTFGYNNFYIAHRSNINTISESNLSLCFTHPD
jgi:hypothetical protein